jgi:hypothetical protein
MVSQRIYGAKNNDINNYGKQAYVVTPVKENQNYFIQLIF